MDLALDGRVALITGASRGIGKGIAQALAREGCKLVICARGGAGLAETAGALRASGAAVRDVACDVTEPDAPQRLVDAAVAAYGRLDILVNNVGGNNRTPFAEQSDAEWQEVIDLNLLAGVRMTRAALPHLAADDTAADAGANAGNDVGMDGGAEARTDGGADAETDGGAVVFVSSIWGRELGGPAVYVSTKAAMIGLAGSLARDLAPLGVRVNSVAPGSIRFPGGSWDRRVQADPDGMAEFVSQEIPGGRFGTVAEVADVVAFLVSPRASWVNGTCIPVDGCQSRSLI